MKYIFRKNVDKDIKDSYEKTHSCAYWDVFVSNFEKLIDEKIDFYTNKCLEFNQDLIYIKIETLKELKKELRKSN